MQLIVDTIEKTITVPKDIEKAFKSMVEANKKLGLKSETLENYVRRSVSIHDPGINGHGIGREYAIVSPNSKEDSITKAEMLNYFRSSGLSPDLLKEYENMPFFSLRKKFVDAQKRMPTKQV